MKTALRIVVVAIGVVALATLYAITEHGQSNCDAPMPAMRFGDCAQR